MTNPKLRAPPCVTRVTTPPTESRQSVHMDPNPRYAIWAAVYTVHDTDSESDEDAVLPPRQRRRVDRVVREESPPTPRYEPMSLESGEETELEVDEDWLRWYEEEAPAQYQELERREAEAAAQEAARAQRLRIELEVWEDMRRHPSLTHNGNCGAEPPARP